MPIRVTDVLTNKHWILPNSSGTTAPGLRIAQFGPGRYDVTNGSGVVIGVIGGNGRLTTIPNGRTYNFATQENDRTFHNIAPDYAVWFHSGRFN